MKIMVNFKKKLDLCSREMIQQFNIIFKRIFNVLKFKMHNRNFYDPVSAEAIKQHNLSIWPGNLIFICFLTGHARAKCTLLNGSNRKKKVAMSKLMVGSNSQRKNIFIQMVSFYVPIKPWPQQPHNVQVYQSSVYYVYPFAQRLL